VLRRSGFDDLGLTPGLAPGGEARLAGELARLGFEHQRGSHPVADRRLGGFELDPQRRGRGHGDRDCEQ
jgi:hypothetical protein